jgi:hypothetical protein
MIASSAAAFGAGPESYRDFYNLKQPKFPLHRAPGAKADVSANARPAAATAPDTAAFNAHIALWRSFDVPGAVNGTQPAGINNRGDITGAWADSSNNVHGFLRKAGGGFVTFDPPNGSSGTFPTDINNAGDIVGSYIDAAGAQHGFVRSAQGKFTIIDDPSSTSSPPATNAQAMNDSGLVVGYWFDSIFNPHGFVRQIDGSLTTVDPPGDVLSQAYHVNDRGEIGGDWSDENTSHGMLLHRDGKLLTFDAPNAVVTFGGLGQALNIEGSFAGTYADANLGTHGYVRYANGNFAEFTAPGGGNSDFNGTWSTSLNLLGTVVGFSIEADGTRDGYVRFADGTLILADAPVAGQQSTWAWSINANNEFTGFWVDAQGNEHGFVAVAVP